MKTAALVIVGRLRTCRSRQTGLRAGERPWAQRYGGMVRLLCAFDHPKYVVAVMVASGEHGGSVAGPVRDANLERTLAMDEGNFSTCKWRGCRQRITRTIFDVQDVSYAGGILGRRRESADASARCTNGERQRLAPDVEPEADAQGQVSKRPRVVRAAPAPPPRQPNFFERLFGGKRAAPQPAPTPVRRRF